MLQSRQGRDNLYEDFGLSLVFIPLFEDAEVGKILANFCNSETSKIASSLCELALASPDVLHTVLNSAGLFSCWTKATIISELCALFQLFTSAKKIFINPPFPFILLTFLSNFYLNHRDKDGSFLYTSAKLDLLLWPVSAWLKANLSPFYWLLVKHVFLCFPFSFCIVLWKYVTSLQAVKNYSTGKEKKWQPLIQSKGSFMSLISLLDCIHGWFKSNELWAIIKVLWPPLTSQRGALKLESFFGSTSVITTRIFLFFF